MWVIRGHLCGIQRFKPGPREENFPESRDQRRRITQFKGSPDGSDIRRDVFPDGSVTARQCPLFAVLVLQRDGHAIVFVLTNSNSSPSRFYPLVRPNRRYPRH